MTEREIALELDHFMLSHGAQALSFETIAVGGVNSSMPHGVPSEYRIQSGDFVTMDYGAVVGGYHSDMTRTVAVGEVDEERKNVYDIVLRAQRAALDFLRPGVACMEADRAARELITREGYGNDYRHGTGHGVGLRSMSSRFCRLRQSRCWLPAMLSRWSQGFTCPAGLASVSRIWPFLRRMAVKI